MPALKNARHETFAQALAKGMSATDAMAEAGYSDPRNSTRLTKNDEIAARVAELKARGAVRTEVTVASLLAEAEEARSMAMKTGQIAAAVSAIREKGVLAGLRIEKRENTNRSLSEISDDELARIATGGGEGASDAPAHPSKPH